MNRFITFQPAASPLEENRQTTFSFSYSGTQTKSGYVTIREDYPSVVGLFYSPIFSTPKQITPGSNSRNFHLIFTDLLLQ